MFKKDPKAKAAVMPSGSKTKSKTKKNGTTVVRTKNADGTKSVTRTKGDKSVTRTKNAKGKVTKKVLSKRSATGSKQVTTDKKTGAKTVAKRGVNAKGKRVSSTRQTNAKGKTTSSRTVTNKKGGTRTVTKGPKGKKTVTKSNAPKGATVRQQGNGSTAKTGVANVVKKAGFKSGPGKRGGPKGFPSGSSADPKRKSSGAGTVAQRNSLRNKTGAKKAKK